MSSLQKLARGTCAAALIVALAAPLSAAAEEAPPNSSPSSGMGTGCASFKWPLEHERRAFENTGLETLASGAARGAWKEQAFSLALLPDADIAYTLAPEKKKPSDEPRFGGLVAFAGPDKPGQYQVTLSSEGWIDIVQRGAALDATDHSGAKGCSALRKSVRFKVGDAPIVLQISGAPANSIKIAIRQAD
jgi:hypothetical protein